MAGFTRPTVCTVERGNGSTTRSTAYLKILSALSAVIAAGPQTTSLEIYALTRMDTDHFGRAFP